MTNTLINRFIQNTSELGEQTAIKFVNESNGEFDNLSYKELGRASASIAKKLKKYVKKGDPALIMMLPGKEYACAIWGGILSGTPMIPSLPPDPARLKQTLKQFKNVLSDSGARVVITDRMIKKKMRAITMTMPRTKFIAIEDLIDLDIDISQLDLPESSDQSLALLQYTSGSSSEPKGVMTSFQNIVDSAELMLKKLNTDISIKEITMVSWLPPFHTTGLFTGIILPVYHGTQSIAISPLAFLARPLIWLEEISSAPGKIIVSGGPNFAYDICAQKIAMDKSLPDYDLSRWQVAFLGTEPINPNTLQNFHKTFSSCGFKSEYFQPSYGMTEQVCILSGIEMGKEPLTIRLDRKSLEEKQVKIGESDDPIESKTVVGCGRPLDHHTVKIVSPETKQLCQENSIGEIWISGPSITMGYWKKDDLNKELFQAKLAGDDNTYLRTGDLGFFYNEELFITGRCKDLIILRGKNYYPADIEKTVEQICPEVIRGTTVAFSVDVKGTESLCIVAESNEKSKNLQLQIKQTVSGHNAVVPHQVLLVKEGELPRSSLKKIQRFKVIDAYSSKLARLEQLTGEIDQAEIQRAKETAQQQEQIFKGMSETEKYLVQRVAQTIGTTPEMINLNGSFMETGLDSLQLVELTLKISSWAQVRLPDDFGWKFETIKEAAVFVDQQEKDETVWRDLSEEGDTLANFERWVASQIPQVLNVVTHQEGREVVIDDKHVIDFASCNYLGYDFHPDIIDSIPKAIDKWGVHPSWTRIVASPEIYIELEEALKELMGAEHIVAFPTATLTHLGVLPVLCGDGGTIFIDSAAHTSIQEGAHLARAKGANVHTFQHRNIEDLERLLEENPESRRKVIAIDGVYSMSGWWVDLPAYVELAKKHDAYIYLDDAHGFGIIGENPTPENPFGNKGNGIVRYYDLDYTKDKIIYVSVLSKAYSSIGAFITACDEEMMELIYSAPTIVFTGPMPTASLASALEGIRVNEREGEALRQVLWDRTQQLVQGAKEIGFEVDNTTGFPIVFVVIGGIDNVIKSCQILWEHGILITPGIFPAMPFDRGGIRFSVTNVNTEEHVEKALAGLREVYQMIQNQEK